jgi:hypothetical protein
MMVIEISWLNGVDDDWRQTRYVAEEIEVKEVFWQIDFFRQVRMEQM